METVLLVEDDRDIAELIRTSLGRAGFRIVMQPDAERALSFLSEGSVSAILLDLMLPGMDGFTFIRKLRKTPSLSSIPVIIISARDDDTDIVAGLELGAEDYIVKPFSLKVLEARLRAVLRRHEPAASESHDRHRITCGLFMLDRDRHEVTIEGKPIDLSATEFAIFELLIGSPGRVFSRDRIISEIRGGDIAVTDRSIDVHILSIRRKLGEASHHIETVRGVGYRFRVTS